MEWFERLRASDSRKNKMAKLLSVVLKAVVPVLANGAKERALLEEDLRHIKCHRLMERL